ncbi:NrtR DNA-binding winged helix domain-containing protein [Novosphingobium capsulatum]|uniref:NrtR DNA-binding winged helix domain-containing protein n=1 Tax=Novosphingobium capsulatum TaxID=13688 RepID=UPI0035B52F0E
MINICRFKSQALLNCSWRRRSWQANHGQILGKPVNKPAFHRRLLDTGWIEGTGQREMQTVFRPAEFYSRDQAGLIFVNERQVSSAHSEPTNVRNGGVSHHSAQAASDQVKPSGI